jgi:hypothetical protein
MSRFFLSLLILLVVSCNSLGIKLAETKVAPSLALSKCTKASEVRTYRVLFLLPVKNTQVSGTALLEKDSILSIKEYAKPWDIGFTLLGFLFSLNSSTTVYNACDEAELQKMNANPTGIDKPIVAFPHYKSVIASKPAEQLLFPKDDYHIGEAERVKLVSLAQSLLKAEEKFQVLLVGKTNTSGDIAYQTRLTKRRAEEIKAIFSGESFDADRIHTVFTDKDFGGSESVSTIAIFLIKEDNK